MEMGQCGTEVTQFLVSTKSIIRSVPLILLLTVQDLLLSREYLCLNNRSCPIAKCWQFFPQRRAAVFLWLSNQRQSGVPHAPEADVLVFVARRAAHADRADYIAITIPEQNPTGKSGHPAPAYVDHAIHLAELGGVAVLVYLSRNSLEDRLMTTQVYAFAYANSGIPTWMHPSIRF